MRGGSDPDPSPAPEPQHEGPEPTEEEMQAHLEELRQQLAQTPVEAIVAQIASQLFEVAALHLSVRPPNLQQAQLAIDAMGALVEGLAPRLGPDAQPLTDGLSQIRLAFVQIRAAFAEGGSEGEGEAGQAPPPEG